MVGMVIHSKRQIQTVFRMGKSWRLGQMLPVSAHYCSPLCPIHDFKFQRTNNPEIQAGDGKATSLHLLCRSPVSFSEQFHKHLKISQVQIRELCSCTWPLCRRISWGHDVPSLWWFDFYHVFSRCQWTQRYSGYQQMCLILGICIQLSWRSQFVKCYQWILLHYCAIRDGDDRIYTIMKMLFFFFFRQRINLKEVDNY